MGETGGWRPVSQQETGVGLEMGVMARVPLRSVFCRHGVALATMDGSRGLQSTVGRPRLPCRVSDTGTRPRVQDTTYKRSVPSRPHRLIYVLQDWLPAVRAYNLACTAAAKDAQTGDGGPIAHLVFTAPPLPGIEGTLPAVVARDEGGLNRLFDLIAEIKENDACTDPMCLDLGIIGSAESGPDTETITPEITAARSGSTVKIGWGWGGFGKYLDAIEIVVDRATGTFVPLTTDTTPTYTDSAPQPPTSAIWKYKAIYRIDDEQVGQWSPVVSVVVGG